MMRPLRILHLYSGNLMGGIESLLIKLPEYIDRYTEDITIEFALCFRGSLSEELLRQKKKVHFLGEVAWRNPKSVLRSRDALKKLLTVEKYDGVAVHGNWPLSLFWKTIEESRTPYFLHLHNELNRNYSFFPVLPDWQLWLSRHAKPNTIICASHFIEESVKPWFPHTKTETIYNPYEPAVVQNSSAARMRIRNDLRTPSNATVFIAVSRLEPWKGVDLFIKALSEVQLEGPWEAWIVGGAQRPHEIQYLRNLQSLVHRYDLSERVKFLGWRNDISNLLVAADVFGQANRTPEPFGLVFLEALAAGLPIVTFSVGGPAEIITPECGVLVPPGDVEGLGKQLERTAKDLALRNQCRQHGPKRQQALSSSREQTLKLVQEWNLAGFEGSHTSATAIKKRAG